MLEDAGMPLYILGQIATLIQDVDGFLHKWVRVQVPRDREAEARELLAEMVVAGAGDNASTCHSGGIYARRKLVQNQRQLAAPQIPRRNRGRIPHLPHRPTLPR